MYESLFWLYRYGLCVHVTYCIVIKDYFLLQAAAKIFENHHLKDSYYEIQFTEAQRS